MGALARQQRNPLDRAGQSIALEIDLLVVSGRNDALVGGELRVYRAGDELPPVDFEEQVTLAAGVPHVALPVRQQSRQLAERLLRQDRPDFALRNVASVPLRGGQRQAVAVGCDQAHRAGLEHEQRAVQKIARVLPRDRELRLHHHAPQGLPSHRLRTVSAGIRQRRKILSGQSLHPGIETVRRHVDGTVRSRLEPDLRVRQRPDNLEQLLGRNRQRPGAGDRRLALAPQPDFEIGRQQAHAAGVVRLEQHVPENRNGVLALDDPLAELKLVQKSALLDGQFHGDGDLDWRARIGWLKTMYWI